MGHGIVIISNRQKGLIEALSLVFPNAHHNYYLWHLVQNYYRVTKDKLARKYMGGGSTIYRGGLSENHDHIPIKSSRLLLVGLEQ